MEYILSSLPLIEIYKKNVTHRSKQTEDVGIGNATKTRKSTNLNKKILKTQAVSYTFAVIYYLCSSGTASRYSAQRI